MQPQDGSLKEGNSVRGGFEGGKALEKLTENEIKAEAEQMRGHVWTEY